MSGKYRGREYRGTTPITVENCTAVLVSLAQIGQVNALQVAAESGVHVEQTRAILADFESQGLVARPSRSRRRLYEITAKGQAHLGAGLVAPPSVETPECGCEQQDTSVLDRYSTTLLVIVSGVLDRALRAGVTTTVDAVVRDTRRTWRGIPVSDVERTLGDLEVLGLAAADDAGRWVATTAEHRQKTGFDPLRTACEHKCSRVVGHSGPHLPRR